MKKRPQVEITQKINFLSSRTGVEPMTFQKYPLDALTTELLIFIF